VKFALIFNFYQIARIFFYSICHTLRHQKPISINYEQDALYTKVKAKIKINIYACNGWPNKRGKQKTRKAYSAGRRSAPLFKKELSSGGCSVLIGDSAGRLGGCCGRTRRGRLLLLGRSVDMSVNRNTCCTVVASSITQGNQSLPGLLCLARAAAHTRCQNKRPKTLFPCEKIKMETQSICFP